MRQSEMFIWKVICTLENIQLKTVYSRGRFYHNWD